jgi:hypothetical protein
MKEGTMKACVLTVMIFILPANIIFSQSFPNNGNWKLQIIGTPEEFSIEIDGTTWVFESDGNKIPQIVTVDNDKKTVIIPLLAGLADYYSFEIKSDYIDLKAGGKFNFPILDGIRTGITGMEGINSLTDDFVEEIIMEIESAFYKIPIMRLYRN